jgi:hypothetical protein
MFANPVRPRTMTKEWQEATEEYMKVRSAVAVAFATVVWLLTRHSRKELSPLPVTRV